MGTESDKNGNFHDENGRFVSLRDYVERIFDERETATEFARLQLEKALVEARLTTERAMNEARDTVTKALIEAKTAADAVTIGINDRLKNLESGGAPFASRLDQSLTELKDDVVVLKENMVKTKVLDALREQMAVDQRQQKKQVRAALIAATFSFAFSLIIVVINIVSGK